MISESLAGLRILIVEDILATQQMLCWVLERFFSDTEFVTARTVESALSCLDSSLPDSPFDVAILDFKLPLKFVGENPESAFSVSTAFAIESPETVLVHITAYPDDPEIQRYLKRPLIIEAGHLFVAKDEESTGDWLETLVVRLTKTLHNQRVRLRFNRLFGNRLASTAQPRTLTRYGVPRCDREIGFELAVLCSDAEAHWDYLTPILRADLQYALGTCEDVDGTPRLGVIKVESTNEADRQSQSDVTEEGGAS